VTFESKKRVGKKAKMKITLEKKAETENCMRKSQLKRSKIQYKKQPDEVDLVKHHGELGKEMFWRARQSPG
jgi:hypothetical protein